MKTQSKIGVRLFLLFLLTAVVPVVSTIIYFNNELKQTTLRQTEKQLASNAKHFSETIFNKLKNSQSLLKQFERELTEYGKNYIDAKTANEVFTAIGMFSDNGTLKVFIGDGSLLSQVPLDRIESKLISFTTQDAHTHIAISSYDRANSRNPLIGIINPTFLWLNEIAEPDVRYTVLENKLHLVTVIRDKHSGELILFKEKIATDKTGSSRSNQNTDEFISQSLNINFEAIFNTEPWHVVTTQHKDIYTIASDEATQALTIISFSILLLVTLISSRQIRNIVSPLAKLTDATQRIATQDFHEPLLIERNDEIGQLAHSFNQMSGRLGKQFRVLNGLTIIDESILTGENIRNTSELILREICAIFACQQSMLCLLPENQSDPIQTLRYDSSVAGVAKHKLLPRSILEDTALPLDKHSIHYKSGTDFPRAFKKLSEIDVNQLLVSPVFSNNRLIAYMAAGFTNKNDNIKSNISALESFSRRVGVAIRSTQDSQKLYRRANYDALTGLSNRAHFIEQLNTIIKKSDDEISCALMFIDLDRFKHVNDVQGHGAGDKLLKHVANKLKATVNDDAIVARFGGDEFLILLPGISSLKYVEIVAQTIINDLSQPIAIDFHEHFIDSSIGIAMYPEHGKSAEILIKNTDIAMYLAKQAGGASYQVFNNQMNANAMKRVALESALYHAIERDELYLVYQPKMCIAGGIVCGAEALIRWQHPIHGLIPPDQFVAIAEETGQILPIGTWVIRSVIMQIATWEKQGYKFDHIAINASVRQIKSEGFVEKLKMCLDEYRVDPSRVEIEITETMFIDDMDNSIKVLEQLHQLGVSIAIDDFGTGYSSLNYLSQLPFDTLKIDQSFLDKVHHDPKAASLTSAIIALAHSLGKNVVAEGVETEEQLRFLSDRGCHYAQGFYYAKPLSADDFKKFSYKQTNADESASA
ncbi:MAG: EAL domain-containing protein [Gammaproteobacteria bacterium]|nr:EAL domain-containing protein [Gammaproteobacteria bacterium]